MARQIEIDDGELKNGVLGLVMALVEVIVDALRVQACRRVNAGSVSGEETERLGLALLDLDEAIVQIKRDHGINEAVRSVRAGLDDTVDDLLGAMILGELESGAGR